MRFVSFSCLGLLKVAAFGLIAISAWCIEAWAMCPTPLHLRAVVLTDSSATLRWRQDGVTGFEIIYKPAHDTLASWQSLETFNVELELTDLMSSTLYECRVRSICPDGASEYSESAYFSTGPFSTPRHLAAGAIAVTSAVIFWSPVRDVPEYEIDYRRQGTSLWITQTSEVALYRIQDLTESTTYEVRVRSVYPGPNYSDYAQTVVFSTSACNPPDSILVESVSFTEAILTWKNNPVAIRYELRYRPVGADEWHEYDTNGVSAVLRDLSHSTTYEYGIRSSCDTEVHSDWSSILLFATYDCGKSTGVTDTVICRGSNIVLGREPGLGLSCRWTPPEGLSDSMACLPIASPRGSTDYVLEIYAEECPSAFDTVKIVVLHEDLPPCAPTARAFKAKTGVNYWPNPADRVVSIYYELSGEASQPLLDVFDVQGRHVLRRKLLNSSGVEDVDTGDWLPGLYVFSLNRWTQKVMIAR